MNAAHKLTEGVLEGLGGLASLDAAAREVAAAPLTGVPDDLLGDMRRALGLLGPEAWRALAAVDAELVERARKRPRPQGRPDLGGGHRRRVSLLATGLGTSRRTMMRNAAAHRLLLLPYTSCTRGAILIGDVLARAEYFFAALRYPPEEQERTLRAWAAIVEEGGTPSLTGRAAATGPLPATATASPSEHGTQCDGCRAMGHIVRTLQHFRTRIIPDSPSEAWAVRLYMDWMEDLNDALDDLRGHAPSAG